jgi:2-isopropylmalate synthase
VTEGIDAMADVTIRLKVEEEIYTGHAAHTDIIVASAKAYLQALNKQIVKQSGRPAPVLEHV